MEWNLTFGKSKHMVKEFYQKKKNCHWSELNYHQRVCEPFSQAIWTLKAVCVVRGSAEDVWGGGGHCTHTDWKAVFPLRAGCVEGAGSFKELPRSTAAPPLQAPPTAPTENKPRSCRPWLRLWWSPSGPCTQRAARWAGDKQGLRTPFRGSDLHCLNPGYECGITCIAAAHGGVASDHMLVVVARILVAKLFPEWHLPEY